MEYKGEIFEPGKLYRFKNNGPYDWVIGELVVIDPDGRFRCAHGRVREQFDMIAELSADEIGSIVQKPVELVHGKCYSFNRYSQRYDGFYNKRDNTMRTVNLPFNVDDCSNFVELVEKNHE